MSLTLSKKSLILVAVPLAFELCFVASLSFLLERVDEERAREAHSHEVAWRVNRILGMILQRGTVIVMRYRTAEKKPFTGRLAKMKKSLHDESLALQAICAGHPREEESIARLEKVKTSLDQMLDSTENSLKGGDKVTAMLYFMQVQKLIDDLFVDSQEIVSAQAIAQKEGKEKQALYREWLRSVLMIGLAANFGIAIGLAVYFNQGTTRRLKVLMDNTFKLAAGKPLGNPLSGGDEIAHLDRMFHRLARELQEASEREGAIVDNALDLICSIDEYGTFTAVSPASKRLLGYEPDILLGSRAIDFIAEEDKEGWREALSKLIQDGSTAPFEVKFRHGSGNPVDLSWSISYSARQKAFFCVAHDITERKEVERLKQEVVAMVSHDLRSPLSSINNVLQMLADGSIGQLTDDGSRFVGNAQRASERMLGLLNDLLALEKMKAGALELDCDEDSLDYIIDQSVQCVRSSAQARSVRIKADPAKLRIFADRDRIIQVVVNLLANAIRYSPEGGEILISSAQTENEVEVRISDRGRGVPEELAERIFERFQQVSKSDSRELGGSGLGLAICKAIVEAHGGSIGVDCNPGGGSTFWFKLPGQDPGDSWQEKLPAGL